MTNLRIPPRQDFDVSEQVYEWLRGLSTTLQKQNNDDLDESINTLLGFFKALEGQINDTNSQIDTTEQLNAKIRQLEETISLLPEESELSLFKAFLGAKSLEVKTFTYSGTIPAASLALNVPITQILGNGECFVEIATAGITTANVASSSVTSDFTTTTNVILTRLNATDSVDFVLKVKDYI